MQQEHLEPASQLIAPLLKGEWHPIHFFHCLHILQDMPATQDFVIISSLSRRKYWWPHHCGPWCSECVSNLILSGRSENKPILIQHHRLLHAYRIPWVWKYQSFDPTPLQAIVGRPRPSPTHFGGSGSGLAATPASKLHKNYSVS